MPSVAKAAAVEESGGDSVPWEFTEEAVEASREGAFTPYEKEMKANNSLNATFLINNPWLEVPQPGSGRHSDGRAVRGRLSQANAD